MATAAPSPPPPCSKRTPTRFHRRGRNSLPPVQYWPSTNRLAKQSKAGSCCYCKDRNSGRPDASAAVLSERKCGGRWSCYLGMGILPSQLYLQAAAPLSPLLARPRILSLLPEAASDHHHAMSSPRRLLVNHKQAAKM